MSECIIWSGSINNHGYGRFGPQGRESAHRNAYQEACGTIPSGYEIHHLCLNKLCINPEHMIILTPEEHGKLHSGIKRTHCFKGHELTGNNIYVRSDGRRECRICKQVSRWFYYRQKGV